MLLKDNTVISLVRGAGQDAGMSEYTTFESPSIASARLSATCALASAMRTDSADQVLEDLEESR